MPLLSLLEMVEEEKRLLNRIRLAEERLDILERKRAVSRVRQALLFPRHQLDQKSQQKQEDTAVYSFVFTEVPGDYYQRPMAERARLLNCAVCQMCKTLIVENTAASHSDFKDITDSRFYCIVVQYEGA